MIRTAVQLAQLVYTKNFGNQYQQQIDENGGTGYDQNNQQSPPSTAIVINMSHLEATGDTAVADSKDSELLTRNHPYIQQIFARLYEERGNYNHEKYYERVCRIAEVVLTIIVTNAIWQYIGETNPEYSIAATKGNDIVEHGVDLLKQSILLGHWSALLIVSMMPLLDHLPSKLIQAKRLNKKLNSQQIYNEIKTGVGLSLKYFFGAFGWTLGTVLALSKGANPQTAFGFIALTLASALFDAIFMLKIAGMLRRCGILKVGSSWSYKRVSTIDTNCQIVDYDRVTLFEMPNQQQQPAIVRVIEGTRRLCDSWTILRDDMQSEGLRLGQGAFIEGAFFTAFGIFLSQPEVPVPVTAVVVGVLTYLGFIHGYALGKDNHLLVKPDIVTIATATSYNSSKMFLPRKIEEETMLYQDGRKEYYEIIYSPTTR